VKTLATRVLEARNVPFQVMTYEVVEHLPAAEVAAVLGLDAGQTFKTLVALPERPYAKPILALMPGDSTLDLKKLAEASDEKKVRMASHKEAEHLTGLEKGGIAPLALVDKMWPVFVDETAILYDRIEISAGKVGVGVLVAVQPLLELLQATLADLQA
jgi:Cys-tRNA(Pro)/Cys-tRNA(Cys) deacylase